MNCCKTVDICLNGITMSTDEYSLGHFSLSGSGEYDEDDPAYDWYLIATTSGTDKMRTDATYGFNDADAWNLEKSVDTLGNETNYSYNDKGLLETVTDPKGNETSYTYDAVGRTTMVESGSSKVEYTYGNDLLTKISVDSGAVQYGFEYDSLGRKTAVTVGNGESSRTLAQYLYVNALLSRQTYGNGTNFIDFYYDSLDRLLTKTYNNDTTKTVHYLYDPNGNQYGVVDNIWGKKTLFEYDLASRVNGVGVYDLGGIMRGYESIRYNDGKNTVESIVHSMFNSSGAKLKVTEYTYEYGDPSKGEMPDVLYSYGAGGRLFTFAYDDLGRLTTRTLGLSGTDGIESYTYMASSKGEGYTSTVVESMTDFTGKTHTYTYDDNGNILTDTYDGNTVSYEYDSLNRMTRFNDPVFGWTYVYVYDDRGNITEMREYEYSAGTLPAIYNSYEYTYGDSTWADLLTSYWGEDISYDELGNPLNWIWGETLTWQNGRQLASYDGTVNYSYNADGLRVAKSGAKNTEYYVVNGTYIGEVSTVNGTQYVISYVYDENGSVAGLNVNGSAYYFAKNLQGDVTAILDYQGNVVANYRYDAYGAIISVTDASGVTISSPTHIANLNPFRYRGYMYDSESGFYYLRSRYYDPFVGRFLNGDTLVATGQGFDGNNMFAYCGNNPVMRVDTSGRFWGIVVGIIAVAAVLLTTTSCSKKESKSLPYKSADDAAKAFSEETYDICSYSRLEISADIYSQTDSNGNTTYNYTTPKIYSPHSSSVNVGCPKGTTFVAYVHTHPNEDSFSPKDIQVADDLSINAYVIGPSLELIKYVHGTSQDPILVGGIVPTPITESQKLEVQQFYSASWYDHFVNGVCPKHFGCESMEWPNG